MSGGVDSSVAAALLKDQGYEVISVTMPVWPLNELTDEAQRVAHKLGIPHYVVNFCEIFEGKVVTDFCREYSRGRTPNPCIRCNQYIKFGALLNRARELDANLIATGHYARIEKSNERYILKKGVDTTKDQSYALYTMTQDRLEHTLMPLGNLTKERVRQIAQELGLPVASKPESQEICFIPDNDYPRFLEEHMSQATKPGPILNRKGNILGEHRGIIHYTIGQRRGLGIPAKEPLYVVAIDPDRNAVIIGSRNDVYEDELIADEINWIAFEEPPQPIEVKAKIRYLHRKARALVNPLGNGRARIKFEEPQMAITPGQAVVFYDGEVVVGGGTIEQGNRRC